MHGKEFPIHSKHKNNVKPGAEVFLEQHLGLVKSKRVGLITNPSGIDRHGRSLVNLFAQNPDIDLIALFAPEHGIQGNAQSGECVPFQRDKTYGLPVYSLYGQSETPHSRVITDMDERMRSFDTTPSGKGLEEVMIKGVDVMVYDIQDVGTRIYTYIATMASCMEACAEKELEFIVLDRPNPINGRAMEGPLLNYPEYSSFVGLYPIPVRHGMTTGELALLFNERYLKTKASLTVIPMEGWGRDMWFDDTSLPWVPPSPNMPSLETATVYPGQVFLEGTNISEGRGTPQPFELFGAPWIDGQEITHRLNGLQLPGVRFEQAAFTPNFSKHQGELCSGAQIHVKTRGVFRPFVTSLSIIKTIMETHAESFTFHADYFDKIMGNAEIRAKLISGLDIPEIVKTHETQLEQFAAVREPFLLY